MGTNHTEFQAMTVVKPKWLEEVVASYQTIQFAKKFWQLRQRIPITVEIIQLLGMC